MSLDQMRERMPALRRRDQTLRAELQAIADQANEWSVFLRLAETLTAFLNRMRSAADTLSITERQQIVRLVVKDVLIRDGTITIRHSISIPQGQPHPEGPTPSQRGSPNDPLCKGSDLATAGQLLLPTFPAGVATSRPSGSACAFIVNYADDFVICCRPVNAAVAMAKMEALMIKLGLEVNKAKTRIARLPEESFDFLGYTIGGFHGKDGRINIGTRPSKKAVRSLLTRIHERTMPQWSADTPLSKWHASARCYVAGAATSIRGQSWLLVSGSADTPRFDSVAG